MPGKKIRHRAHGNLSRVLQEKGGDDRPCRRVTTRRTSVSQVGAVRRNRRRDVRSHATGHYRIKYRQAAFSDGESRARNREKNARIRSGFSLSPSLFPSFVLFLLGLSVDSSAPQSVCPPTPAALIIGSAKLSPSNSSPTFLLTFSLLFPSSADDYMPSLFLSVYLPTYPYLFLSSHPAPTRF